MKFGVLGPLQIRADDGSVLEVRPGKVGRTLCALLSRPGEPVPVAHLIDVLWPETPPRTAAKTVQSNVCRLRRDLGEPSRITTRPTGYAIMLAPGELDAQEFAELLRTGQAARGSGDLSLAAERLRQALRLWRGRPFTGLEDCQPLLPEVQRLVELRIQALEELIDVRLEQGESTVLVPELAGLVAENPYHERLSAQLMLALHRSGRQSDALEVYRRTYARLVEDLGVQPGQELGRLHAAILRSDPALDRSAQPAQAAQPAQSGQPAQPATVHEPRPAQLPPDPDSLTGRRDELTRLLDLATGDQRTVVISAIDGMAGVGKTVLAVHAAHRLAPDYPDGQFFLDLHGFTHGVQAVEPQQALDRLLRSIGVSGDQIPVGVEDRAALWRTRMAGKHALVLLDNAASEQQVQPLLPASPGCLVLITSRLRLGGLDSAHPLSLDVLPAAEAVALFRDTAGRDRLTDEPDQLIGDVVDLCGRLPLAIRLLATRLRDRPGWSLADLADRLRDKHRRLGELDAGRRSVAGTFELSYQQLDAAQQRLFRLLGLHPGSDFDAYAAAALADVEPAEAERMLESLVDVHLLQTRTYGRYTFHDLLRLHAAEAAGREESEQPEALTRLLDHYLFTVSKAMDQYAPYERHRRPDVKPATTEGPEFASYAHAVAWLEEELANVVAAAGLAADGDWPQHAREFSESLFHYVQTAARYSAAIELHGHALRAGRNSSDRLGEAQALNDLGCAYKRLGRHADALSHLEAAAAYFHEVGHQPKEAAALSNVGWTYYLMGRLPEALDNSRKAAEVYGSIGRLSGEANAWAHVGEIQRLLGRTDEALASAVTALERARRAGDDPTSEGEALETLGLIYLDLERYEEALEQFQADLRVRQRAGNPTGEYFALVSAGNALQRLGRHGEALDHQRQALAVAERIGDRNGQFEAHQGLGETFRADGRPEDALAHLELALALAEELQQSHDQGRALEELGRTWRDLGDSVRADELGRQALAIYRRLGTRDVERVEGWLGAAAV